MEREDKKKENSKLAGKFFNGSYDFIICQNKIIHKIAIENTSTEYLLLYWALSALHLNLLIRSFNTYLLSYANHFLPFYLWFSPKLVKIKEFVKLYLHRS